MKIQTNVGIGHLKNFQQEIDGKIEGKEGKYLKSKIIKIKLR